MLALPSNAPPSFSFKVDSNWYPGSPSYEHKEYQLETLTPFVKGQFHILLTLSSKFFSTFPHGTCLLLALPPVFSFVNGLPQASEYNSKYSYSTLKRACLDLPSSLGPSPFLWTNHIHERPCHGKPRLPACLRLTVPLTERLSLEQPSCHSLLLRRSPWIPFPPLIDMLKSSGSFIPYQTLFLSQTAANSQIRPLRSSLDPSHILLSSLLPSKRRVGRTALWTGALPPYAHILTRNTKPKPCFVSCACVQPSYVHVTSDSHSL